MHAYESQSEAYNNLMDVMSDEIQASPADQSGKYYDKIQPWSGIDIQFLSNYGDETQKGAKTHTM